MDGYVERSKYEALEKEVRRLQQLLEKREHSEDQGNYRTVASNIGLVSVCADSRAIGRDARHAVVGVRCFVSQNTASW
jgi:hypothetical protein